MQFSRSRLARTLAPTVPFLAFAFALACARPAPTVPEKTAVYETPLDPSAEPVEVEFESVTPRGSGGAAQEKEPEKELSDAEAKEPEAKSSETKSPESQP